MSDLERAFLELSRLGTVFENLCFLEPKRRYVPVDGKPAKTEKNCFCNYSDT